jgi:hypothetical protein
VVRYKHRQEFTRGSPSCLREKKRRRKGEKRRREEEERREEEKKDEAGWSLHPG